MNLVALPVLTPLFAAALLLLLPTPRLRRAGSVLAAAVILVLDLFIALRSFEGEVLVVQMAGWPAPWGISLVADRLSSILLLLSGVVGVLSALFMGSSLLHAPRHGLSAATNLARERFGSQALLHFLIMGVNLSFLTGDLFNLFVAFEVMLIASYGLMLLGNELPQFREGFKYVVINLLASAIFVMAAGFAYGLFGTLNMADIALRVAAHGPDARVTGVAGLLALVFATKSALFPLGFWLPNAYPAPAAAASAFFAALLTKVGVYALIRSFTLMFPQEAALQSVLLALAGITVLIGSFGMIARQRWRHAFAFANVASIGYLAMGAFSGAEEGSGAALYYLIHSVLVIFALFLVAALAEKIAGEHYLDEGHLSLYPWLGVGYFILALAIAGIPPTSGFIGKYAIIAALLAQGTPLHTAVALIAVLGSLLILYGGMQIWQGFFWGESDAVHRVALPLGMRFTTVVAVLLVVALALWSGPVFALTSRTARDLQGNGAYVASVLRSPEPFGGGE